MPTRSAYFAYSGKGPSLYFVTVFVWGGRVCDSSRILAWPRLNYFMSKWTRWSPSRDCKEKKELIKINATSRPCWRLKCRQIQHFFRLHSTPRIFEELKITQKIDQKFVLLQNCWHVLLKKPHCMNTSWRYSNIVVYTDTWARAPATGPHELYRISFRG